MQHGNLSVNTKFRSKYFEHGAEVWMLPVACPSCSDEFRRSHCISSTETPFSCRFRILSFRTIRHWLPTDIFLLLLETIFAVHVRWVASSSEGTRSCVHRRRWRSKYAHSTWQRDTLFLGSLVFYFLCRFLRRNPPFCARHQTERIPTRGKRSKLFL